MNINWFEADTHHCHRRNHGSVADCLCLRITEKNLKLSLDSPLYAGLVQGMPTVFVVAAVGCPTSCRTMAWAGTDLMTNKTREHREGAGPDRKDSWMGGVSMLFTCESRWSLFTFYRYRTVSQQLCQRRSYKSCNKTQ